jgi:hypothetical protein
MKPYTPRQKALIVSSFKRIFQTNDINNLTPTAYRYIYQAGGFIAHYNLHGFRDAYQNVSDLKQDILQNQQINRWSNFYPGEENYDYYQSKGEVYAEIVRLLQPKSNQSVDKSFAHLVYS